MAKLFAATKKITLDDYFAIDACNWSTVKEMGKSELHYQHRLANPLEDSVSLAKGRAIHTAVLEPKRFVLDYVIFEGKIRRGKEWDAFKEQHANKTILKVEEYDKSWAAAEAVLKHPVARELLEKTEREKPITWRDSATGLVCKCRVDAIGASLIDLKSTTDVDARKFGNLAARLMYHGQMAMYRDGTGHKGEVFIIAVEVEPPYDVAVFEVTDDALYAGQELYTSFLKRVKAGRDSGLWPGRYPNRTELVLPRYAYEDEEQEDGTAVVVDHEEDAE